MNKYELALKNINMTKYRGYLVIVFEDKVIAEIKHYYLDAQKCRLGFDKINNKLLKLDRDELNKKIELYACFHLPAREAKRRKTQEYQLGLYMSVSNCEMECKQINFDHTHIVPLEKRPVKIFLDDQLYLNRLMELHYCE